MINIDKENRIVKKIFDYEEHNEKFMMKEIYWLKYLESKWVPELIEVGPNFVSTRYYGPDCLELWKQNKLPDITEQVVEMYKFFKEKNVFKLNGALSNLTLNGDQLVAFDFKWARERDNNTVSEIESYEKWLSKIDIDLVERLKCMI